MKFIRLFTPILLICEPGHGTSEAQYGKCSSDFNQIDLFQELKFGSKCNGND